MATALRGFTQMTAQSGSVTISWPTGTVVGDLAVLVTRGTSSVASGWIGSAVGNITAWFKTLNALDLASGLTVRGRVTGLQTFYGAASIGQKRHDGITLSVAGAGVLLLGENPPPSNSVPPTSNRVGTSVKADDWVNQLFWLPGTTTGYVRLSGTDDDASYSAWEILPKVGPSAPTLTAPMAGAQVDTDYSVAFGWSPNSTQDQEQVKVRVRPWTVGNTGTWQWVKSDGTWTTTDTAITQEATTLSLNSGLLVAGTLYEWTVATYDSGSWSGYAPVQQLMAVAKPTVSLVSVSSPAESLSPTVSWAAAASVGSLTAWQAAISASAADPGISVWVSGMQGGSATATAAPSTTPWVSGQTLYAYVRVMQSGGLWSAWTRSAGFTVSWTPPSAPSTVIAFNQTVGPLQVAVTGLGILGVQVEWSLDGSVWSPVVDDPLPGATRFVSIPLAPYGIPQTYRARTYGITDGVKLWSDWVVSTPVASTDRRAYLVDDVDQTAYLPVYVSADQPRKQVQGVSVSHGWGSLRARVDRTVPAGEQGQTTLRVNDEASKAAIVAWLTTKQVWWLRWNPERNLAGAYVDAGSTRMVASEAVSSARIAQVAVTPRQVSFSWVQQ